jgi:hypothetical protein
LRTDPFVFKAGATRAQYSGGFADSTRTLQTAIEGVRRSSIYYHLRARRSSGPSATTLAHPG